MTVQELILGKHPNNTCFSFNWHNIRHLRRFIAAKAARLPDNLKVADIGCGYSPYFPLVQAKSAQYFAVDMQGSLPLLETRPIQQLIGVAESIPMANSTVNLVLCNQVLEHVQEPETALAEIFRILEDGGTFIGSVPHVSPVHLEPYDFRRYTTLGVEKCLSKAGFEILSVEGNCGVFSTVVLVIFMDLFLSRVRAGRPQFFNNRAALILAPVVGILNLLALLLDTVIGDRGRTPANICWLARKPLSAQKPGTKSPV